MFGLIVYTDRFLCCFGWSRPGSILAVYAISSILSIPSMPALHQYYQCHQCQLYINTINTINASSTSILSMPALQQCQLYNNASSTTMPALHQHLAHKNTKKLCHLDTPLCNVNPQQSSTIDANNNSTFYNG